MRHALAMAVLAACAGPVPTPAPPEQEQQPEPLAATVRCSCDGADVPFTDARVSSVDDANEHFEVLLGAAARAFPDGAARIALQCGELHLVGGSWGGDADSSSAVFPATREQAAAVAKALGMRVQLREPWRGELSAVLRAEPVADASTVPLRFEITNTGPVPVWLFDGGRSRNQLGRDNRFTFLVLRDGRPMATRAIPDFGGMGQYRRLEPTASWTLEPDLAHWCALDRPGQYIVRATYEAELMPDEFEPNGPQSLGSHAHLARTRKVIAETTIVVR